MPPFLVSSSYLNDEKKNECSTLHSIDYLGSLIDLPALVGFLMLWTAAFLQFDWMPPGSTLIEIRIVALFSSE